MGVRKEGGIVSLFVSKYCTYLSTSNRGVNVMVVSLILVPGNKTSVGRVARAQVF